MKKAIVVFAIAIALMVSNETKAQSAVGMGPGMIYHTNYNGAIKFFRTLGTGVFWCFAYMGAAETVPAPIHGDDVYLTAESRIHLPVGGHIFDSLNRDITGAFRNAEFSNPNL
jgi:hypothetical protein